MKNFQPIAIIDPIPLMNQIVRQSDLWKADTYLRDYPQGPFGQSRGHRAGAWWTPIGVRAGRAPDWEHTAATGIARAFGWLDDAEWTVLRKRALGAAARGTSVPSDERLVAAARVWLAFVDDPVAARVIARPTVEHDPLAIALDALAQRLTVRPFA